MPGAAELAATKAIYEHGYEILGHDLPSAVIWAKRD
jgi:hypothetical protein